MSTLFARGRAELEALARALGVEPALTTAMSDCFGAIGAIAGDREIEERPLWSAVCDDCTPYELSIGIRARATCPDVRFLLETHREPASPRSYWDAGLALNAWLDRTLGADLHRFDRIADLFVPASDPCFWAMWHAVDFGPSGGPLPKVYLNTRARGPDECQNVVSEALMRLGFERAWDGLAEQLGPEVLLTHMSLDLAPHAGARVKTYLRHQQPNIERIEASCQRAFSAVPGDVRRFAEAICGDEQTFAKRPVYSVHHFTDPSAARPARACVNIPLSPTLPDDLVVMSRIERFLESVQLPTSGYRRAVMALQTEPLERTQGLHTYVSFQREHSEPRATVYFGSRAYQARFGSLAMNPTRTWPSPVGDLEG